MLNAKKLTAIFFLLAVLSFVTKSVPVLAQDQDDFQNYGERPIRITNACNPQIPSVGDQTCQSAQTGAWSVDISWFDPVSQNVYIADRNNKGIDIIDTVTDTVIGMAGQGSFVGNQPGTNTSGPNGVLVTDKPHQVWAGDGNSHVLVFALDKNGLPTSTSALADINTGGSRRADELCFDPDHQLILVANDDDADLFVTFITVSSDSGSITKAGQISFKDPNVLGGPSTGGIEQCVYDTARNRFLIAIPASTQHPDGEIAVINPANRKLESILGLNAKSGKSTLDGTGCNPHGLTVGPKHNLLLGCSADGPNGKPLSSIVMDDTSGEIIAVFDQVGGSDEVWFNPADNHYYLAASNFALSNSNPTLGTPNPAGTAASPGVVCGTGAQGCTATPVLGIIDAGSDSDGPQWVQNIKTGPNSHSVTSSYSVKPKGKDGATKVTTKVYVPLRITPTIGETGGVGVIGRIP